MLLLLAAALTAGLAGHVDVQRVPANGIQPLTAVAPDGVVHLVYYTGDDGHGDLYYVHSQSSGWSAPLRVNSVPGSAIAVGSIRGARLALSPDGTIHVAWNFSQRPSAMIYTRLLPGAKAFDPERDVSGPNPAIDGGGALAADSHGNVYVFWHAPLPNTQGEANRRVWLARSRDNGATFEKPRVAWDSPVGACGCCGMNAYAYNGAVYVLFRSATEMVHRDMYLLTSRDSGATFTGRKAAEWNVGYCVMSSSAFAASPSGVEAAWETERQVYFAPASLSTSPTPAPGPGGDRRYPALARNAQGETLLAWTEGMGWKKGGSLAWQLFDPSGHPEGPEGHAPAVPVWSFPAAIARPNGSFVIYY